jgi:hypothetical protein
MEDYNSNLLNDSKNEWSIRLTNILSGHIIDGFRSIFNESMEICEKNDEPEKYLMTFQNFLSTIPKWNQIIIDKEVERIKNAAKCKYLEDLITCVHIIQLKILSCVRTSNESKKIDIDIPCFKSFLHVLYINIARKLYSNIYLFQIDTTPLEQQKNNREFEIIVQTCIMNTIRDNIPVEELLKQYIDETQEVDVIKTEKIISENDVPLADDTPTNDTSTNDTSTNDTSTNDTSNEPILTNSFEQNTTVQEGNDMVNEEPSPTIGEEKNDDLENLSISFDGTTQNNEDDYEKISIGDEIKLNTDDASEIINLGSEINLKTEDSEKIDLGVEEFSL